MKVQSKQEVEDIVASAAEGGSLVIISGEGDYGTPELYDGELTLSCVLKRLTSERCNGDRWAKVEHVSQCCATCAYWVDATADCTKHLYFDGNDMDIPDGMNETLGIVSKYADNNCECYK
jgi:sulfatase maturation enzyme AslB (radical SAM superfamily)